MKAYHLFPILVLSLFFSSCKESSPGAEFVNDHYTGNRAPLISSVFIELPLGSIQAEGWLEQMLISQKHGLTGNLDRYYPEVMGPDNGWLGGDGDQWERGPYWIHGLLTLAYTLNDEELIAKTTPWVEWMLASQKENGYFGPDTDYENKPGLQRNNCADWWPRMVALKILKQYYSATGDERVLPFMSRYFKYQLEQLPETPLDHWTFWGKYRGGDNLQMVYWLYNRTGELFLLDLAEIIHEQTFNYTDKFLEGEMIARQENIHCVNLAQGIKEPLVYYQQSQDPRYMESVKKAFKDLDWYSNQPSGMFGGDEALRNSNPVNGIEFCSVVELMYSLETIIPISGDIHYADHLEKIAFNALPAQATDDFMARQYFQQGNQVMITRAPHPFSLDHAGTDICFGLKTGYPCCTSNMHQGWPQLTQNLWYATPGNGLAAVIYAPSVVSALVGDGIEISIQEESAYPFEDNVRFNIRMDEEGGVEFPFTLRIPAWSDSSSIRINDEQVVRVAGDQFYSIERKWENGDKVELQLQAEIQFKKGYENSVSIERGSLVYALAIEEKWNRVENEGDRYRYGDFYYEVLPGSPWNYAIKDVEPEETATYYKHNRSEVSKDYPWNPENAPVYIVTSGRRIPDWKIYNHVAGPLPYSIKYGLELDAEEEIKLIPYGCTALRISAFPRYGSYSVME